MISKCTVPTIMSYSKNIIIFLYCSAVPAVRIPNGYLNMVLED